MKEEAVFLLMRWARPISWLLPFVRADVNCLALPEILAEKIRACYQRNKARDIYDLGI